jgi:hypothetical protein
LTEKQVEHLQEPFHIPIGQFLFVIEFSQIVIDIGGGKFIHELFSKAKSQMVFPKAFQYLGLARRMMSSREQKTHTNNI